MNARTLTRTGFLSSLAGAMLIAAAPEALATGVRNLEAEQFVQAGVTSALQALANRGVPSSVRHQTFEQLIAEFSDMPRIAFFVLGRYGSALRTDAQLRTDWYRTFQEYSIATYEDKLDDFSNSTVRVTDSLQRSPTEVIVSTEMTRRGQSRPTVVQWRLYRAGSAWKVNDVAIAGSGAQIWLAARQQGDFLALLENTHHGDIRALMADVQGLTARMRQRVMARS